MYTLKVDYETVDNIVKDVLTKDYIGLCSDIESLQATENLEPWAQEDLDFNIRIRDAMMIVFEYYLSVQERKDLLGS